MASILSNRRKAATLLVALGPERAAEMLRSLDEAQVRDLVATVSTLGPVEPEAAAEVLREAAEEILARRRTKVGDAHYARELLARTVGHEKATTIADEIDVSTYAPFRYLADADPAVAAGALAPEPAPTIALALAHLEVAESAAILMALSEELRGEVALRMAALSRIHPEVVDEVNADFQKRLTPLLRQEVTEIAGMANLVAVLNKAPKAEMSSILDQIEERDPELAAQIRDSLFVFDDIVVLDDLAIQQVLKTVDTRDLSVALKDADDRISERILANLSERARENLLEEIEYLKNVKRADIEEARKKVVRVVRQLEDAGTITIDRGDD